MERSSEKLWDYNAAGKVPLYAVDQEKCIGCGRCNAVCVSQAAHRAWNGSGKYEIDEDVCCLCGKCTEVCPQKCISDVNV